MYFISEILPARIKAHVSLSSFWFQSTSHFEMAIQLQCICYRKLLKVFISVFHPFLFENSMFIGINDGIEQWDS